MFLSVFGTFSAQTPMSDVGKDIAFLNEIFRSIPIDESIPSQRADIMRLQDMIDKFDQRFLHVRIQFFHMVFPSN